MKYEKLWIFLVLYITVVVTLLVFALSNYISAKECSYETESECRNSIDGYLGVYDWINGWAKNCEREGKIFTVDKRESGEFLDPRCAIEQNA